MIGATLLSLTGLAEAQTKTGATYRGRTLQQWLDTSYVELPEARVSLSAIALRKLDPGGLIVKPQCLKMLAKNNAFEQIAAANVLWRTYKISEPGIKVLIKILKSSPKHKDRAMTVLSRIGAKAKDCIPLIGKIAALQCPEQSYALTALERFGSLAKSQLAIVKKVIKNEKEDKPDRFYAARAHWLITGDESKILMILKLVLTDEALVAPVNQTLEELGEKALPIWHEALAKMPEGAVATFRVYAIEKLGQKSLPYLTRVLRSDRKERVKRDVVMCLGRLALNRKKPVAAAIPLLIEALDEEAEKVVHFATVALGRLGTKAKKSLTKLDSLKNSKSEKIQRSASDAARKIRKAVP
jgi:HEAT repeat protein